jgi:hypothetical protein
MNAPTSRSSKQVLILTAGLFLASCGASTQRIQAGAPSSDGKPAIALPPGAIHDSSTVTAAQLGTDIKSFDDLPLNRYLNGGRTTTGVVEAIHARTASCLQQRGWKFSYLNVPTERDEGTRRATVGYHPAPPADGEVRFDELLTAFAATQGNEGAKFMVDAVGGDAITQPTSCASISESAVKAEMPSADEAIREAIASAPDVTSKASLEVAWSECMAAKGYDFSTPDDAFKSFVDTAGQKDTKKDRRVEIQVASADWVCVQTSVFPSMLADQLRLLETLKKQFPDSITG